MEKQVEREREELTILIGLFAGSWVMRFFLTRDIYISVLHCELPVI